MNTPQHPAANIDLSRPQSLLDYFAGLAMPIMWAAYEGTTAYTYEDERKAEVARLAYAMAEAMLAERKRRMG